MSSERFAETRSAAFELRRHFFRRFFDSELISDPGQAKVMAGGVLAIVLSISVVFTQAYYHKYIVLEDLPGPRPFELAVLADFLFLITLTMVVVGLFTTLQWPSLFPGLRDYLALAGLPLRMRDIFAAKFTALLAFASIAIVATAAPPSGVCFFVMRGRWATHYPIPGVLVASILAGFFVFFSLVTVQGLLLNVLPVRQFARVSLAIQGLLLAALLCAVPMILSIPDLAPYMMQRPAWTTFAPPLWFLGVDQVMVGNTEPLATRLAAIALVSVVLSAASAILTYLWSYRRHRVRVIESPGALESAGAASSVWVASLEDRFIPESRSLAVFGFIAKSLARSRQHRLILTAFAAVGLAIISEGFFSLLLHSGTLRFSVETPAFQQAAIGVPLALSLFILSGLRYLFRLPVELRANWIFRVHEPGNASALLAGVDNFTMYFGVFPVALLTLPIEMAALGALHGFLAALMCLFASLTLMELLLFSMERIPFTSSYFPGQKPPVETVLKYALASSIYIGALSSIVRLAVTRPIPSLLLLFLLACAWLRARTARLGVQQIARLEFEEFAEPAVQLLRIDRD